jgi:branched-chain amino acid transport system substrate-binding protein
VSRIDPATDRIAARIRDVSAVAVATGPEGTWALEGTGTIARLGDHGDHVLQRVRIPSGALSSIAVGAGAVWSTDPDQGTLWRIDPSGEPVERTIPLAVGASDVTFGEGAVWVANGLSGTVVRVDPRANQVTNTIAIGNTPGQLAVGAGGVWLAVAGTQGASLPAASQGDAGVSALPAAVCGPVLFAGRAPPQRLIVSDLPLRGSPGLPTRQMSAAIEYVLREHGFRAGRFRLGYQSCDDSTAQSGIFDDRKCVANAKRWVENRLVVGVIGPYNSGCAYDEIPIADRGGPLAMISPTNSDVGLTHRGPLTPPDIPSRLYPARIRNYARLYPSDDLQAAAMAEFARHRRLSSVYLLDDGGFGKQMAASFRLAATRLRLRVAGSGSWNPAAANYRALVQRIVTSRANGVYLSGLIDTNGGRVIRAIRQQFGGSIVILANNGLLPVTELFQSAGSAARGVYITTEALPNSELGLAGREFVTRFAATQHQAPVDQAAVYAAQATEALLAAIASSNGTRESVTQALMTTCVREGILGSFCFDRDGDPTSAPVAIVRAARPGGVPTVESIDGADVIAVIQPPARLRP